SHLARPYPLSLHDALPISASPGVVSIPGWAQRLGRMLRLYVRGSIKYSRSEGVLLYTPSRYACIVSADAREEAPDHSKMYCLWRSEEHTSELQSRFDLVCR